MEYHADSPTISEGLALDLTKYNNMIKAVESVFGALDADEDAVKSMVQIMAECYEQANPQTDAEKFMAGYLTCYRFWTEKLHSSETVDA